LAAKVSLPAAATLVLHLVLLLCCNSMAAIAVDAGAARITRMKKEVKIAPGRTMPARAASGRDQLSNGGSIRTGADGEAELTFPDQTVTRLGDQSAAELTDDSRTLELREGAVLFSAPKSGRVKVRSGGITASIGGTTGIMERHENLYLKILVLEGTVRVYSDKIGESVLVTPGQMLITKPGTQTLPEAVHFDLSQLYRTSTLVNSGFAPLARRDEILRAIKKQQSDPDLIHTNLIIYGRGTLVNLLPPAPTETTKTAAPAISRSPSPNKPPPKGR
jgi:quercetin dioxygenase-like cupin family protein